MLPWLPRAFYRLRWAMMARNPLCWRVRSSRVTLGEALAFVALLGQLAWTSAAWLQDRSDYRHDVRATGARLLCSRTSFFVHDAGSIAAAETGWTLAMIGNAYAHLLGTPALSQDPPSSSFATIVFYAIQDVVQRPSVLGPGLRRACHCPSSAARAMVTTNSASSVNPVQ